MFGRLISTFVEVTGEELAWIWLWPMSFERKLWEDIYSKISLTKRETTKTGLFIKNKHIAVYHC